MKHNILTIELNTKAYFSDDQVWNLAFHFKNYLSNPGIKSSHFYIKTLTKDEERERDKENWKIVSQFSLSKVYFRAVTISVYLDNVSLCDKLNSESLILFYV